MLAAFITGTISMLPFTGFEIVLTFIGGITIPSSAILLPLETIKRWKQKITITGDGVAYYLNKKNQEFIAWGDVRRIFTFQVHTAPRFLVISSNEFISADSAYKKGNQFVDGHCQVLLLQFTRKLANVVQQAKDLGYISCDFESLV